MTIVAVTLLSVLALLCLLATGLVWMVIRHSGMLVIESKAVAILFKIFSVLNIAPKADQASPQQMKRADPLNEVRSTRRTMRRSQMRSSGWGAIYNDIDFCD
jgi:hypothetical protein